MRRTRAELRAELLKAGRGAGLPLGVAEDLAMAALWFTQDALTDLLAMLETPAGCAALCAMVSDLDEGRAADGDLGAVLAAARARQPGTPGGLEIADAAWARLTALSARTYVPESDQSRSSGAGAGDIDND